MFDLKNIDSNINSYFGLATGFGFGVLDFSLGAWFDFTETDDKITHGFTLDALFRGLSVFKEVRKFNNDDSKLKNAAESAHHDNFYNSHGVGLEPEDPRSVHSYQNYHDAAVSPAGHRNGNDRNNNGGNQADGSASHNGNFGYDSNDPRGQSYNPIVLDLNHDGVLSITKLDESAVFFDKADNGFLHNTAWVEAEDGFLITDLNGNGRLDLANELIIANQTTADDTDLEAFAAIYDSNKDGVFNNQDTA